MPTTTTHARRFCKAVVCKSVEGEPAGTFDTIVSVFGNVDYHGDRMVLGAFDDTIGEWQASGDPVPVIFTHRWDDLLAHIGVTLPTELTELAPGDSSLPQRIRANGGLYARQRLDVEADPAASYAARVAELLERRSLREFSFAYDPLAIRPVNGVDEVVAVALHELGPTLLGANPLTELLAAKARELGVTPKALDSAFTDLLGRSVLIDRKAGEAPADDEELTLGDTLDALEEAAAEDDEEDEVDVDDEVDEDAEGDEPADDDEVVDDDEPEEGDTVTDPKAKAITITPGGSIEERLNAVFESAQAWALLEYGGDLFATHLEGTYLDEGYAIVVTERWEDPWGEGPIWRLSFEVDERGAVTITEHEPVEFSGEFTVVESALTEAGAKAVERAKAKASTMAGIDPATLADAKANGKAGDTPAEDHEVEGADNFTVADLPAVLDELAEVGSEP